MKNLGQRRKKNKNTEGPDKMPFSERTPSTYIVRKKHKTWLHNTILSPLQGKKRVKEVVLNQIRKGQYLEADIQHICI